jgi:exodeoxyribonuclease VII small subunit
MEFKDFEAALKRLEEIVNRLESGEVPLEEALKLFEEGMKLSQFCGKKLDEAERRVEALVKNAGGDLEERPFELSENGGGRE